MIRIAAVILAGLCFLGPFFYGVLFLFCGHWSAFVDFTVAASVVVSVLNPYVNVPMTPWLVSMAIFTAASLIGFFIHFQDSGESGPLPFEWLNQYYQVGIPTLLLIGLSVVLANRHRKDAEVHHPYQND